MTVSPRSLTRAQVALLAGYLPGVRDGDVEAVHQGRVVTRRLRELIPLTGQADDPAVVAALRVVKRAGRALGRVRELDVLRALIADEEQRWPQAAPEFAALRAGLTRRHEAAQRALIKKLERLDFGVLTALSSTPPLRDWRRQLAVRIADEAAAVRAAVHHATGVYFPNRLHGARIALKKFRYSAEVAEDTRVWRAGPGVRDVKKAQETLGQIHDLQVLAEHVEAVSGDAGGALVSTLKAEIQMLHARYLRRRDRVIALATQAELLADRSGSALRTLLPRVAAILLPAGAGLLLLGRRDPPRTE